jgi:hypothetical protein
VKNLSSNVNCSLHENWKNRSYDEWN